LKRNISDKDKKDWEEFLKSNKKIQDKEQKTQEKIFYKTTEIDLHGYSLEKANRTIEDLIYRAYEEQVKKITVVTGKGIHSQNEKNPYVSKDLSILKYSVPEFIIKNKNLMNLITDIKDAKIEDGGSGAFYIYLKKFKK
tara:strand:- start:431 stop:847 length:417 start_codon:yes stop_codon:yes gene_type:complete